MKKLALIAISTLVLVSCRSGRGAMATANLSPSEGQTAKGKGEDAKKMVQIWKEVVATK